MTTSTTSGLTQYSLDVDDIIEQAAEYVKGDWTTGVEQAKARRALNLILIELQNKRVPLNKIDSISVNLVEDQKTYTLDESVSDVLEATLKTTSTGFEKPLDRWGIREYHDVPNKDQSQEPNLIAVNRNTEAVTVTFWPVPPESSKWTAELLVIKRVEDINASFQKVDLPYRYYPLLVTWLSYKLSLTREGVDENTKNRLKAELVEILNDTFEEGSERVDMFIRPGGLSARR